MIAALEEKYGNSLVDVATKEESRFLAVDFAMFENADYVMEYRRSRTYHSEIKDNVEGSLGGSFVDMRTIATTSPPRSSLALLGKVSWKYTDPSSL